MKYSLTMCQLQVIQDVSYVQSFPFFKKKIIRHLRIKKQGFKKKKERINSSPRNSNTTMKKKLVRLLTRFINPIINGFQMRFKGINTVITYSLKMQNFDTSFTSSIYKEPMVPTWTFNSYKMGIRDWSTIHTTNIATWYVMTSTFTNRNDTG